MGGREGGEMHKSFFVSKLAGKRSLGRPRRRWKENIREIWWEGVDWIHLT
jgi:hypothetical protein